jgi:hypothetical protein
MALIQPDLKWYTEISTNKNMYPRCPFATVHRCPRYYASVSLLGEWHVATAIQPDEDAKLLEKWKRSDLWPVAAEQDTAIAGSPDDPDLYSRFCPEVSYDRFRWFASFLAYYADEIDMDVAHRRLSDEGAAPDDWRWHWAQVTPFHYSDCPLYSPLLLGVSDTKSKSPIGFSTT